MLLKLPSRRIVTQDLLKFLFVLPFLILLIVGMTIPSDGAHGLFTIKSLSFLASICSIGSYIFFHNCFVFKQIKLFSFSIYFLFFLTLTVFYSLLQQTDVTSLYDQTKLIFLTFIVVIITLFLAQEKLISYQNFFKVILYANFTYSLIKLLLVVFVLIGLIDLSFFLEKVGIRFMSMSIYGNINRLQTSVDIVTPFLLFFVLQSSSLHIPLKRHFKIVYIVISILAIMLSFSRFLLMVAILSIFLSWLSVQIWDKFKWFSFFLFICFLSVAAIGVDQVSSIIEVRFFSQSARESDSTRSKQIDALITEFQHYPLLGKGIGSYSKDVIRDETNRYSYEVQWMAFLMQFGLIGILFLSFPFILIAYQFLNFPISLIKINCLIIFLTWMASGLFNPFLISLSSGIMYAIFAWTGIKLNQKEVVKQRSSSQAFSGLN